MKITCTSGEKKVLMMILENEANLCPFDVLEETYCNGKCRECLEKNIEWDVKDGDGDG